MRSPRSVSTTSMPCASRYGLRPHSSVSIDLLFTTRVGAALAQDPEHDARCARRRRAPSAPRRRARVALRSNSLEVLAEAARACGALMRGRALAQRLPLGDRRRGAVALARARTRPPRRASARARRRRGTRGGGRVASAPSCVTGRLPAGEDLGDVQHAERRCRWRRRGRAGGAGSDASTEVTTSAPAARVGGEPVEPHPARDVGLVDGEGCRRSRSTRRRARARRARGPRATRAARATLSAPAATLRGAREPRARAARGSSGGGRRGAGSGRASGGPPSTSTRNSQSSCTRAPSAAARVAEQRAEVAAHHRDAAPGRAHDVLVAREDVDEARAPRRARLALGAGVRERLAAAGLRVGELDLDAERARARRRAASPTSGQSWST